MNSNTAVMLAHEYAASKNAFVRLHQIMSTSLSIPCSDRYNARYGEKHLHNAMISISLGNSFAESGMKRLAIESASKDVPSGSWVRDTIGKVPEQEVKEKASCALQSTLEQLRKYGIFKTPVTAAIDKHKVPRYDQKLEPFLTRGEHDRGTTVFETYITLQSVDEGKRAQIACEHVGHFDENPDLVEKLVKGARNQGIKMGLLLMDREFFSIRVITRLNMLRQIFLMPCKKTAGIKKAILEYASGKREYISRYTMKSGTEKVSFTLVILPKTGSGNEGNVCDRYLVFATNISRGRILSNVHRLSEEYRKRWGIETGYVGLEQFRPRTTSRNHTLRLMYFYYPLLMYNAWLLANLILADRIAAVLTKPIIHIQLMKGVFHTLVVKSMTCQDEDYALHKAGAT